MFYVISNQECNFCYGKLSARQNDARDLSFVTSQSSVGENVAPWETKMLYASAQLHVPGNFQTLRW